MIDPGLFFRFTTVITIVGGTMFLMWLGEQITARGIGNGISLIIFAGIVANLPSALATLFELSRTGGMSLGFLLFMLLMAIAVITCVVFMERAQRRILVQYPKRQVGNRMYGGDSSHLPLKLNTAGVIPPIFASSLLLMPATVISFGAQGGGPEWLTSLAAYLGHGQPLYLAAVCQPDHFLRVLLHRRGVQSRGDGGEPAQIWRLHSRHASWEEHRRHIWTTSSPGSRW